MSAPQFVIAPCMGVGKIVANVTRRAAYLVHERNPRTTALLSTPALLAGDPEQRELVQHNPVILIDGCADRCASHIFHCLSVSPVAKVEVVQVMTETRTGPGKTRQQLEGIGKRLADIVAERIERAMRDESLLEGFAPAAGLRLAAPKPECAGCQRLPTPALAAASGTTTAGHAPPPYVTIFPCQGLRFTGGRVTQRCGYLLVEERFPGRTLLLCLPALASAVQEDVDMLEQFPAVAINGCRRRCASVIAAHYGVPAAASVELEQVEKGFDGGAVSLQPDLTDAETAAALKLADAVSVTVSELLRAGAQWQGGKADLHGAVHQPAEINTLTGYNDTGKGFLAKTAQGAPADRPLDRPPAFHAQQHDDHGRAFAISRHLDVRGLTCPMPALQTIECAQALSPGEVLEVVGDWPGSKLEVPYAVTGKPGLEVVRIIESDTPGDQTWWIYVLKKTGDSARFSPTAHGGHTA